MQVMRALWAIVVTGCWNAAPAPRVPVAPAGPAVDLSISETNFGPLDGDSPATLANLRKLFAGYEVRPVNDSGIEYRVYAGSEELFFVVTNDDASIFNVHATSGKVSAHQHPWRVGQPFQDAAVLTRCECWGGNPTCYRGGEHVAVNFNRECDGVIDQQDRRALKVLDGLAPQRMIWSPTPFGPAEADGSGSGADDPLQPPPPPPGDDDDDGN
jgi:hypothetical protein